MPLLIFQDKLPLTNRIGDVITEEEPEVDIQQNKISNRIHDGNTYYWSLPSRFLGNQLRSYAGYLTFTIENEAYGPYTPDQDIIIRGNGLTLYGHVVIHPRIALKPVSRRPNGKISFTPDLGLHREQIC